MAIFDSRNPEPKPPIFTITRTASGKIHAVAPRYRQKSPGDWIQEAVTLAWDHHLVGALRFRGVVDRDVLYSCTDPTEMGTVEYHLRMNLERQTMQCNCDWYRHTKPCPHIGALILVLRQVQESAVPRNIDGQLRYEAFADFMDAS